MPTSSYNTGPNTGGPGPGSPAAAATQQATDMSKYFPDTIRTAPTPRVDPSTITSPSNATVDTGGDSDLVNTERNTEASNRQRTNELYSYARSLTDTINGKYNSKVANDKDLIAAETARARVLNSKSGNTDSGTGSAALDTVQRKGNDLLAADEAARTSDIGTALGKVDTLRQDQAKANALQKQNDLKNYNDQRAKNVKTAQDSLTQLGKNGVDAETLKTKEPHTYATLQKEMGYTDLEMTAYMNNAKGANAAKFQYKVQGDTVTAYGVDKNGKLTVQEETVPGLSGGNYEIKETKDGALYKFNKSTGEMTPLHAGTGPTNGGTSYSKNQETDAKNWLALQPGFDKDTDYEKFESDPSFKAWAIQQAVAAKPKKGSSAAGGSNPF